MKDTWFTSDTHLRHKNILRFQPNRNFDSIEEHDEAIIENWNKVVKPNDDLWFLGDFSFCSQTDALKYLDRLNGNLCIIVGNHDTKVIKHWRFRERFRVIESLYELRGFHKQPIVLCHYPMESWNRSFHGAYHFHGHTHGSLDTIRRTRKDVGVDTHPNLRPWHIDELIIPENSL